MSDWVVRTSRAVHGEVAAPASKSHSLRAVLFASLAEGESSLRNLLPSPDLYAMVRACEQLGARLEWQNGDLRVLGTAGNLAVPDDVIHAGNSGLVLRFIGALAGLIPSYSVITGDYSIRHQRPAEPLLSALRQLGATAESLRGDGYAPLIIRGPMKSGRLTMRGEDSQPVSGMLFACSFLEGPSELSVVNAGEKPWIDLSLYWLRRCGVCVEHEAYSRYVVPGGGKFSAFEISVPGDYSSSAFLIAAALITGGRVMITHLDPLDPQGDKALIPILQAMGADIRVDEAGSCLFVDGSQPLESQDIDINPFVDALPILAVIGTFSHGKMRLYNGAIARKKECDRIACICRELRKMGARLEEHADGLTVYTSSLKGTRVESHQDHRIAMALAITALRASGETFIESVDCVRKTFPNFVETMHALGASLTASEPDPHRIQALR